MVYPVKVENDFKDTIYFSYYDDQGKIHHDQIRSFKHYFYSSTVGKNFLDKRMAVKRHLEDFGQAKFQQKNYPFTYEADFSPAKRFILDQFHNEPNLPTPEYRVAFLDIENDYGFGMSYEGEYPVTAISVYDTKTSRVYTFAWHPEQQWVDKENFTIVFKTEGEMIDTFVKFWKGMNFGILSGFNVQYDLTYLASRMEKFFNATNFRYDTLPSLSPYGKVYKRKTGEYKIVGVNVIDYREAYIKFVRSLPSNSLDYIANEELKEGKVKFKGDLRTLWKNDPKTYIEYNRQDVLLLHKLDQKLQLMNLMKQLAGFGFINIEDCMKFSIIIDNMIIQKAMQSGHVVKSKVFDEAAAEKEGEDDQVQGAYNYDDLQIGFHQWILDMDATSMYPFIMMNLNISPETKDDAGTIVAGNGQHFTDKYRGVVPQILEWMFQERDRYKKLMKEAIKNGNEDERLMYMNKQLSVKKVLNSFYGVSASKYFRFYDRQIAEAVTLTGQKIIKHALGMVQGMGYKVITGDSVAADTELYYDNLQFEIMDGLNIVSEKKRQKLLDSGRIKIEEYWDKCSGVLTIDDNGKERKKPKQFGCFPAVMTLVGDVYRFERVEEIIRHKTNKKMYRVTAKDFGIDRDIFVDVTEDHSLIIGRNGESSVIKVKPTEIKQGDRLYLYDADICEGRGRQFLVSSDFDIQEISYEGYVYDICIPNSGMFFANGILVSNTDSVLFTAGNDCTVEKAKVIGKEVGEKIDESLTEFCKQNFNIDKQNFHFKQEIIADAGMFVAKKHYIMHKVNIEGIDVDEMEFKGIDIVRNDTPKKCKEYLRTIYEKFIRDHGIVTPELQAMIEDYRNFILNAPYQDIMIPTSLSKNLEEYTKSNPPHVVGARYWDTHYAAKYGKSFHDTDRGSFIFVKVTDPSLPDTHVLSIPDGVDRFVFSGLVIDYESVMERLFVKKLEDMYYVIRIEILRKMIARGVSDDEVFSFIYDVMLRENSTMFELKKIKYNSIINRYSKMYWDLYNELIKRVNDKETSIMFKKYVQDRLEKEG